MTVQRSLAGLFASLGLALAIVLWTDPGNGKPLLAAQANCGGYNGPVCTVTEWCLGIWPFKTCTKYYTYWRLTAPPPGGGSGGTGDDGGKEQPATPNEK